MSHPPQLGARSGFLARLALAATVSLLTLVVGLLVLRRLAPRLVGVPVEVKLVQSSEAVPPFYEHVFEGAGTDETLADPVTATREAGLQRARPGLGPTDVLGFRNASVPNAPDVVVIGDSQTYGVGVEMAAAWPQQLGAAGAATVYNMSSPGWGPTQYVEIARLARRFRPKVVLVAYYTGNDPADAFLQAYNNPRFARLKVSDRLQASDAPRLHWTPPQSDHWPVAFRDGVRTILTPAYRDQANDRAQPGVREGYDIIARSATVIAASLEGSSARAVFTIIPTKELAYLPKLRAEKLQAPGSYDKLVEDESANIAELQGRLRGMRKGQYLDLVAPLQQAASGGAQLYPADTDGHPAAAGHAAIAKILAAGLQALPRR
jgi:hypothetical protein